jgi:hypothetical protein
MGNITREQSLKEMQEEIIIDVEDGPNNLADLMYKPRMSLHTTPLKDHLLMVRVTKHFRDREEHTHTVTKNIPEVEGILNWISESLHKHNLTES